MLNIDETIVLKKYYFEEKDLYIKSISYSTGVIIFLETLRAQVPEINLLQLIPGFYLFLVFISFFLLVFFSDLFIRLPLDLEVKKTFGTKNSAKLTSLLSLKFSFVFFYSLLIISLNTILPVSLDSFNSYGEKTLENIWSFDEVINLEVTLLTILLVLSQIPLGILFILSNEKNLLQLPRIWRILTLLIIVISGILTPTIDGYTQLNFSISSFSFYIIIINLLQKRLLLKFRGYSILGF